MQAPSRPQRPRAGEADQPLNHTGVYTDADLDGLVSSITRHGRLSPIRVRGRPDGRSETARKPVPTRRDRGRANQDQQRPTRLPQDMPGHLARSRFLPVPTRWQRWLASRRGTR